MHSSVYSPVWISHRGYCRTATENTAEAFRAAQQQGFTHLETDLRTTADGHLVLVHDPNLSRLTGESLKVEQSSRKALEQVRLPGGERLLFFDQFLEEFTGCDWILDIKSESAERTLARLLSLWQQSQYSDFFRHRVRFLCWQWAHQAYLLRHEPEARCMARIAQCRRAGLACLLGVPHCAGIKPGVSYALPPRFGGLSLMKPALVARYQHAGGRVLAYLPETDADARSALLAGVDEILTNGPILAR